MRRPRLARKVWREHDILVLMPPEARHSIWWFFKQGCLPVRRDARRFPAGSGVVAGEPADRLGPALAGRAAGRGPSVTFGERAAVPPP